MILYPIISYYTILYCKTREQQEGDTRAHVRTRAHTRARARTAPRGTAARPGLGCLP